ncbi:hypothetical protein BH10ACT1_BH10ACT1_15190 [soil metagenome]
MSDGSVPSPPSAPGPAGPPPGAAGPPPGWPGQLPGQQSSGQQPIGQPVAGPPPGYGPPPGAPGAYGPAATAPAATSGSSGVSVSAGVAWSLVSIAAIALAVSLNEDGDNGWGRIGVWAGFAIVAAVATLAPAVRDQLNLKSTLAWQIGVAGAAGLAAFWILFVLPSISQNVSFLATVGCAAGGLAAWLAPGRPGNAEAAGQTW